MPLTDPNEPIELSFKTVEPHQVAWLRRSDKEYCKHVQVWEKPDGRLVVHNTNTGPLRIVVLPRKVAAGISAALPNFYKALTGRA